MKSIEICGEGFRYFAHVGEGLLARAGELTQAATQGRRCAVIADDNSARLFGVEVCRSFMRHNFMVTLIKVPVGEKSKSLSEVERICGEIADAGLDRTSFIVGLGGGVVGDLSGFVAAIFYRGIPHIQLPTTLLAMVDSGIGGKTAVNLSAGKNLVGTIHHPSLVIADIDVLRSLPAAELRQGFAEIVKHAVIGDAEMFKELWSRAVANEHESSAAQDEAAGVLAFSRNDLQRMIGRNLEIKARIVALDERDICGQRAVLNFGHTIGHAIERASDFQIPHGDCVSLGMVGACQISIKRAHLTTRECDEIIALLRHLKLPTKLPRTVDRDAIMQAIGRDKKFQHGEVRFVVTPRIGEAHVSRDVTIDDIAEAVAALQGKPIVPM